MTLPPCGSWFPAGEQLCVPYEAPHGRRVHVIGAHFTPGPEAGRFEYQSWASLPKSRAKKRCKTLEEQAAAQGLQVEEVGPIDAARVLAFVWRLAGRPAEAPEGWQRARPLKVVLDNYAVHTSQTMVDALPTLEGAGVQLVKLPSYSPELSRIEPDWHDVKQHGMPVRSFERVADLKRAVDAALARKAAQLRQAAAKTTSLGQSAT
jgi:hypothetical protein